MKRLFTILLAGLFAVSALLLPGCTPAQPDVIIDILTPAPDATSVPASEAPAGTDLPTDAPIDTIAPTDSPATPEPTQAGPVEPDQSVFDDAAFIGNSVLHGLYLYNVITHGKFYTKVGLNVNTVFTAQLDNSSVPVIDELRSGTFNKVILYFGSNELGWPSYPGFIDMYSQVFDAVLARQPGCRIYVLALLPTTHKREGKGDSFNNANIQRMNDLIEQLCADRGITFIDVPGELCDSDGYLLDDATVDGEHFSKLEYCRIWADHICLKVMGAK